MYTAYRPILFNRAMMLKVQREKARLAFRRKMMSEWEYRIVDERNARVRDEYRTLNPEQLRIKYFTNPEIGDYQTVFTDIAGIKSTLAEAGCSLKVLHPLEYGFEPARRLLEACGGVIDRVEIYNMQDSVKRDPDEILRFAHLVDELNEKSAREGTAPFIPVCGSDSTGRAPTIPGMGFIREDKLKGKLRKQFMRRHIALPAFISAMVEAEGVPVGSESRGSEPKILSLGKTSGGRANLIGDENSIEETFIPPARAWRYLNPALVNAVYAAIGFLVAQRFIGTFYALLWLFITAFRNSIADLVAGRGSRMSAWNLKGINFNNVTRSLFWTGFSVPIMAFVKTKFDALWPLAAEGLLFDSVKFFFIAFANGLYLAFHNTLRGFDKKVVRANFWRSVIAWPLATVFAPLGAMLGIPSIVQSKIWSDFVAGFIEGGSKYVKILGLRRRDLEEILPLLTTGDREERYTALLDLLFMYREEPRTESSLKVILSPDYRFGKSKKGDKEAADFTFMDFKAALMNEGKDHELVDFILSSYQPEMAADLMDLVSKTLPACREWVAAHTKRFSQQVASAQAALEDGTEPTAP